MLVDNKIVWLFVWIVVADIITGFLKSLVTKKTSSRKGTDGLIRHGALLLIIMPGLSFIIRLHLLMIGLKSGRLMIHNRFFPAGKKVLSVNAISLI